MLLQSSSVLAQRDATEWMSFFAMFGLTSGHNIDKNYQKDPKECYNINIVYEMAYHISEKRDYY